LQFQWLLHLISANHKTIESLRYECSKAIKRKKQKTNGIFS
jgi:hypothetical protein